jgi:DNA polymerase-4
LGVGISNLAPAHQADPSDLIDRGADKRAAAERAMDKLRGKFGAETVGKGRGVRLESRTKK